MALQHCFIRNGFGLIVFQLIILLTEIHGQSSGGHLANQDRFANANLMAPQSFSFTKYGGHTPLLSTGELNLQIPIYTYRDADFQIPISLGYGSAGFMPNQREGTIGLGWHLNGGGGAVTRIVNGVPDDTRSSRTLHGYYDLDGLLYGIKNNLAVKSTSKANIFNLTAGTIETNWYWHIGYCEVDPDLFSFNVPGLSGKFYLENNGEVRCVGSKPFRVDLTGVAIQYMNGNAQDYVDNSTIIITTDDGYEYRFGGTMRHLDVVFRLNGQDQAVSPVINSWHLTKITAPNGRTVDYIYKSFIQGIHQDEFPNDPYHYLYILNTVRDVTDANYQGSLPNTYDAFGASNLNDVKSVTKTSYIEKISINGRASISFQYAERDHKFYTGIDQVNRPFNQKNYRLNRIEVSEFEGEKRKDFEFVQSYDGGTHKRMFLSSFQEKGTNPYTFSYHAAASLPSPLTGSVDHWGFWNAAPNTHGSVIPMTTFQANGDADITGTERNPDFTKSQAGMLSEITYPTLGYSRFHYEGHQYAKRLDRRNDFNFLPKLYDVSGVAGGIRLARIEQFDGNTLHTTREFKYTKGYPSGSGSSGILMRWPRYIFYWEQNVGGLKNKHLRIRSTSFNTAYSGLENYIQYSEVTEVEKDNGYTVYKFTNYETNPDENDYMTRILNSTIYPTITNVHLWNSYVGIKFNDKYFERGVPWHIQRFKHNGSGPGILIQEIKTTAFTGLLDFPDSYLIGAHQTGGVAQSFKRYYYPFLPKTVQETSYDEMGLNPVTTERKYEYNTKGYAIKESLTKSDGQVLVTATSYPSDYTGGTTFIDNMVTQNLLAYPIERVQYKQVGTARTILSGQVFKYKTGGKAQLDEVLNLEPEGALSAANIIPPSGTPAAFSPDSRYKVSLKYNDYDTYGNPIQYTVADGAPVSYFWGYSGRYPIAEVQNANKNDIAYTSFEGDKGNWNYSGIPIPVDSPPTGKQVYPLSAQHPLTKTGLTTGKRYVVSYWREGGNSGSVAVSGTLATVTGETVDGWTYEEKTVSAVSTVTVNGSIRIDEVRLYPEDSQMTTYTHHPLKGMTSNSAVSGITTYYEYDFYDRLRAIRNKERKLLEVYDYHYKNQN